MGNAIFLVGKIDFNKGDKLWRSKKKKKVRGSFCGGLGGEESTCNVGDLGPVPRLGRSPGEANSYQLQYSGLENSMDRGTW